jgi:hypothetical protein
MRPHPWGRPNTRLDLVDVGMGVCFQVSIDRFAAPSPRGRDVRRDFSRNGRRCQRGKVEEKPIECGSLETLETPLERLAFFLGERFEPLLALGRL